MRISLLLFFLFFFIFVQNSQEKQQHRLSTSKYFTKQHQQQQANTLLIANQKTQFFMDKVLKFITESSSLLCIECFKRDSTRMLTCLSQTPMPDRVDFIRQRCPIPSNLYAKIVNKYLPVK